MQFHSRLHTNDLKYIFVDELNKNINSIKLLTKSAPKIPKEVEINLRVKIGCSVFHTVFTIYIGNSIRRCKLQVIPGISLDWGTYINIIRTSWLLRKDTMTCNVQPINLIKYVNMLPLKYLQLKLRLWPLIERNQFHRYNYRHANIRQSESL